jgi:hypothetical protein
MPASGPGHSLIVNHVHCNVHCSSELTGVHLSGVFFQAAKMQDHEAERAVVHVPGTAGAGMHPDAQGGRDAAGS